MARARNIKPNFYKNYDLADCGSHAQLLFSGLWCLADREGLLEDKPRFIKAEIFPYYEVDINGELTKLQRLKFIDRYTENGIDVIEVLNFKKHQSPHNTEKKSDLPKRKLSNCNISEIKITVNPPLNNDGKTPDSLIPDSLNTDSLIPDSPILIPDSSSPQNCDEPPKEKTELQKSCIETWRSYASAYFEKYQTEPVRNLKVNAIIKQFVQRIGLVESPSVAAHYLSSNNAYYVARGHSFDCLLADAEKMRTEWATGKTMTQTRASQIDKTQSNKSAVGEAMQLLGA